MTYITLLTVVFLVGCTTLPENALVNADPPTDCSGVSQMKRTGAGYLRAGPMIIEMGRSSSFSCEQE